VTDVVVLKRGRLWGDHGVTTLWKFVEKDKLTKNTNAAGDRIADIHSLTITCDFKLLERVLQQVAFLTTI
jgi:hypothetical protein